MALRHQIAKKLLALTIALTLGAGSTVAPGVGASPSAQKHFMVSKVVINIPSRTLWVYEGERIVHYYPVGVGRPGFMTPVGKFAVLRKIIDPGWEHPYRAPGAIRIAPGENNPLGTRWIGFHRVNGGEYGMHGTDNPSSVGRFSSHGCVRMKTRDVEELFDMVEVGTPVEVVYEPVLIRRSGDDIRLIVFRDAFNRGMPNADEIYRRILREHPTAQVDMERVRAALRQPNERPQEVARVLPEFPEAPASDVVLTPAPDRLQHPAGPMAPMEESLHLRQPALP